MPHSALPDPLIQVRESWSAQRSQCHGWPGSVGEKRIEAAHLGEDFVARHREAHSPLHPLGHAFGEVVRFDAGLLIRVALPAKRRVDWRARTPHLVALADVIARVAQQQRKRRDRVVPDRALQDRAAPGVEEVTAG